jgi:hypothetical protein
VTFPPTARPPGSDAFASTAPLDLVKTKAAAGGTTLIGGIGIAAGSLVLLALAGLFCFLFVSRRKKTSTLPDDDTEEFTVTATVDDEPMNELDYENPLASGDDLGSDFGSEGRIADLSDDLDEGGSLIL